MTQEQPFRHFSSKIKEQHFDKKGLIFESL